MKLGRERYKVFLAQIQSASLPTAAWLRRSWGNRRDPWRSLTQPMSNDAMSRNSRPLGAAAHG